VYVFQKDYGGTNNWGQVAKLTTTPGSHETSGDYWLIFHFVICMSILLYASQSGFMRARTQLQDATNKSFCICSIHIGKIRLTLGHKIYKWRHSDSGRETPITGRMQDYACKKTNATGQACEAFAHAMKFMCRQICTRSHVHDHNRQFSA
jgi:hypothetical protein